jgi:tetratricopeptide (TPR) repeat protein
LENPLSRRFAETAFIREGVRRSVLALGALVLAACGASTPQKAAVDKPAIVAPSKAAAAAPATPAATGGAQATNAKAEPSGSGRRGRRGEPAPPADPASAPIPAAAQSAYDRALTAMRTQDWLRAESELGQLTREYPAYPGPQVNLAIVYRSEKRPADARAALDRALAIDPKHAAANNELGILLRETGKFEEAERAYRRAIETDPGYALAHYNLGVLLDVYLRRGAEAIEQYEAYQSALTEPDKKVAGWLIDLRRRFGNGTPQVAKENGE